MIEAPQKPVHQRILKLCGESPDVLDPKVFNGLSEDRQKKVLYNIRSKLSGEDRVFEGKKKKFKLAVQALKTDTSDAITHLQAELHGYEGPRELAKFWTISTKAGALYTMAEERGLDADRIVRDLMQLAQDEGPSCEKRLHDLLMFDGSVFSTDTTGSSSQGRMEARLKLLQMLDRAHQQNPEKRLQACIFNIAVSTDKVLIAQSHEFKNITPYAESLFAMAESRELDAPGLTTEIFQRAVQEGRESVNALHALLAFQEGFWLNDETRGSTEADRMETRLELLQELKERLDRGGIVSVQSASLDIARYRNKVELAQDKSTTRSLEGKYNSLIDEAVKRGTDQEVLHQLFEKVVSEDAQATFEAFFAFRTAGSRTNSRAPRPQAGWRFSRNCSGDSSNTCRSVPPRSSGHAGKWS